VVWLVVEGFLLFADEALAQRFDARVIMDTPLEKCRLRRFLRENEVDRVSIDASARTHDSDAGDDARSAQYALSNDWAVVKTDERDPARMAQLPEYTGKYCSWFEAEVAPWFQHYWATQRRNAALGAHPWPASPAGSATRQLPVVCTLDNEKEDPANVPRLADAVASMLRNAR
jgi:hypothetical protein